MHVLSKSKTHPADALASIRREIKQLGVTETVLKKALIADRESRVGVDFHAVVDRRVRETTNFKRVVEELRSLYIESFVTEIDGEPVYDDEIEAAAALSKYMRVWDESVYELTLRYTKSSEYEQVSIEPVPDIAEILRLLDGPVTYLDVETTGFSHAAGDRVVSLGITLSEDLTRGIQKIFNPEGRRSSAQALAVHGLDDDFLANCLTFAQHASEVAVYLTDRVVVAHNAPFDIGFLRAEFGRTLIDFPRLTGVVDTRILSKLLWPGESASLDAVCERLGIEPRTGKHDALADARLVAQVVERMRPLLHARLDDSFVVAVDETGRVVGVVS